MICRCLANAFTSQVSGESAIINFYYISDIGKVDLQANVTDFFFRTYHTVTNIIIEDAVSEIDVKCLIDRQLDARTYQLRKSAAFTSSMLLLHPSVTLRAYLMQQNVIYLYKHSHFIHLVLLAGT